MKRHRGVFMATVVALVGLLAACGKHVVDVPDGYVSLKVGLAGAVAGASLSPAGAPYEPADESIAVDHVEVSVFDRDGQLVEFSLSGGTYTATPGGSETVIELSPADPSKNVELAEAGNPYRFESLGHDGGSNVIAYDDQDREVTEGTTVLVQLDSVLEAAILTPRYPTNYVTPGTVLDLMLVVMANDNTDFPTDYLQVPLSDFEVAWGAVSGGTVEGASKRGIRVEAGAMCSEVSVAAEVTGLLENGSDYEAGTIDVNGASGFSIDCTAALDGDVTVDLEPPHDVTLAYDAGSSEVSGTADDDHGIAKVQVFDGPILLASTDPDEFGGDVAELAFTPGTTEFSAELLVVPSGDLTVIAADHAGNESTFVTAFGGYIWVDEAYAGGNSDGSEDRPFTTVEEGLSAVAVGGTVYVRAGVYSASDYDITKPMTLLGAGQGLVTIETTASGYGLEIKADDVTLSGFKLVGPAIDNGSNYGIKAFKDAAGMANLTITDVTVENYGRTEIDLNTVTGAVLSNVTADGNGTKGVGIALSGVDDVALLGVTTKENGWGSVGLYTTNVGSINGVFDVEIDAASDFQESGRRVYVDDEYGHPVDGLRLAGFQYAVFNPDQRGVHDSCPEDEVPGRGDDFIDFTKDLAAAADLALTLCPAASDAAYIQGLGTDVSGELMYLNEFYVEPGMSIQTALDEVLGGGTVVVGGGDYKSEGRLEMATSGVTVLGNGATAQSVDVTAHYVTIDDLDFEHTSHLVWVYDAKYLTLTDVDIAYVGGSGGGLGVYFVNVPGGADVSGFTMLGGSITGANIGISLEHVSGGVAGEQYPMTFDDVFIDGTSFENNPFKAIYVEALSNAEIRNVTVENSGNYGFPSGGIEGRFGAGIDINLKFGDYENITFENVSISDSGKSEGADSTPDTSGAALTIKARDDGAYAGTPATLDNVLVADSDIIGGSVGLRLGEIGQVNGSPTNVVVEDSVINGGGTPVSGYFAVMNFTDEDVVLNGVSVSGDVHDQNDDPALGEVIINP